MQWPGYVTIGPAFNVLAAPVSKGVIASFQVEDVPAGGDMPRPNERWYLNSLYCPAGVQVNDGATPVDQVTVTFKLSSGGVPYFSQRFTAAVQAVTPGVSVVNFLASGDLVNPIALYAGSSPLKLGMDIACDQDCAGLVALAGYQCSGTSFQPSPGFMAYQAVTLSELNGFPASGGAGPSITVGSIPGVPGAAADTKLPGRR